MSFDPYDLPIPDLGLRCLNCGYLLAGLPSHRCAECGRAIDLDEHIPKGDWPDVIVDGAEAILTRETMDLLTGYQIPFMESQSNLSMTYAMRPSPFGRSRLAVPRHRYFEVIDLLRRQQQGEPMPPPPPDTSYLPEWSCNQCGEDNPGSFEICWHCGRPPPASLQP
jgi:hypothetical protein